MLQIRDIKLKLLEPDDQHFTTHFNVAVNVIWCCYAQFIVKEGTKKYRLKRKRENEPF